MLMREADKEYALFDGITILRKSKSKDELVELRKTFPKERRVNMFIAEKIIQGPKEHQQCHWMFKGGG